MGDSVTNYKCPACLGPLHYSSETGKLTCDYCGSSFDPELLAAEYQQQEEQAAENTRQEEATAGNHQTISYTGILWGESDENIRVYSCPSCGAELICNQATAATSCPYCGNPAIVPGQLSGALKPEFVIPFKLNQKDAEAALKNHYRRKLLLPSVFSQENNIRQIRGIYVPFWLFDGKTSGSLICEGTNSSSHRSGNYRVVNTRHYTIRREGDLSFLMVPVDGSKRLPDDLMDSLEPYDYRGLTDFSTAYLPGYFADKYDVSSDDVMSRAELRCQNTTEAMLRDTIHGYESVRIQQKFLTTHFGHVHYALLPVWILNTRWNGQDYLFAMNGQTGHFVGKLPVDPVKKQVLFWTVLLVIAGVLSFFFSGVLGRFILQLLIAIFD